MFSLINFRVFSEFQRAFGVGEEMPSKVDPLPGEPGSVISNMKNMEKESHVFRPGDYDDIGMGLSHL